MSEHMRGAADHVPGHLRLRNKACLFIGAGTDVAASMARVFALEGCRVLIVDEDEHANQLLVGMIQEDGGSAAYRVANVHHLDELEGALDITDQTFQQIDSVIDTRMMSSLLLEPSRPEKHSYTARPGPFSLRILSKQALGADFDPSPSVPHSFGTDPPAFYRVLDQGENYGRYVIRENSISFRYAPRPFLASADNQRSAPASHAAVTLQIAYAALFLISDEAAFVSDTFVFIDADETDMLEPTNG
jgi:hypothetical protein